MRLMVGAVVLVVLFLVCGSPASGQSVSGQSAERLVEGADTATLVRLLGLLEREVVEAGAVGPLQHLLRHGEALPVAGRRRAVAPMAGGVEAGDAVDDGGERGPLVLLDETPIADGT